MKVAGFVRLAFAALAAVARAIARVRLSQALAWERRADAWEHRARGPP